MKTSHIVIICVTVFLLVALWLSYKAMVLTAEKKEKEKELKSSPYLNSTPDPFDGLSNLHVGCGYDPNRTL